MERRGERWEKATASHKSTNEKPLLSLLVGDLVLSKHRAGGEITGKPEAELVFFAIGIWGSQPWAEGECLSTSASA